LNLYILTGFTGGIGAAMCSQLRNELGLDDRLVLVGRNISEELRWDGINYLEKDLSVVQGWLELDSLVDSSIRKVVLISNASMIEPIDKIGRINEEQITHINNVNFINPVLLVNRLVMACTRSSTSLTVLNVTSGAANRAISGWALYCSTKAAFKMFLNTLELEWPDLVEVIHCDPGVVDTKMQRVIRSKSIEQMKDVECFSEYRSSGLLKTAEKASMEILSCVLGKKT